MKQVVLVERSMHSMIDFKGSMLLLRWQTSGRSMLRGSKSCEMHN